jgi:hypothetical protein
MVTPVQKIDPKQLERKVLDQIEKSTDCKATVSELVHQFSLWRRSINLPTSFIDKKSYINIREAAIGKMEEKGYEKELVEVFRKITRVSNLPITK